MVIRVVLEEPYPRAIRKVIAKRDTRGNGSERKDSQPKIKRVFRIKQPTDFLFQPQLNHIPWLLNRVSLNDE